jgi:hypothetical protein
MSEAPKEPARRLDVRRERLLRYDAPKTTVLLAAQVTIAGPNPKTTTKE